MARVCLIPLPVPGSPWPTDRVASFRTRLERAGYSVIVDVEGPPSALVKPPQGLVSLVVDRIQSSSGTYLVIIDLAMAYGPGDVLAVVERLEAGSTSLVVAARRGRWFASVARRITGTSDPTSGLVGLTKGAARSANRSFAPVGSRFTCELLARVEGERGEVEVGPIASPSRRWLPMDDIRHAKRIADERFGNVSRLLQFCVVGASGMVIDLSTYAALQAILSQTPLAKMPLFRAVAGDGGSISLAVGIAAFLSIATAMTWNFSLNRRLTFNDARRGSIARQYLRYVLSNLVGSGVSLAFRLILPGSIGFFARHRLAAAVAGIVAATAISFTMARWFVFGTRSTRPSDPPLDAPGTRLDPRHDHEPPSMHRSTYRLEPTTFPPTLGNSTSLSQD